MVDKAGATMNEVVSSIRRVTEIMGEISAASEEQNLGVAQVGEAVSEKDRTVAVFKLSGSPLRLGETAKGMQLDSWH